MPPLLDELATNDKDRNLKYLARIWDFGRTPNLIVQSVSRRGQMNKRRFP